MIRTTGVTGIPHGVLTTPRVTMVTTPQTGFLNSTRDTMFTKSPKNLNLQRLVHFKKSLDDEVFILKFM